MALDLAGTPSTSSQALTRVAVEQVHDQVLGLLRHANGQLEHAALDVVEKLVSKFKKITLTAAVIV